MIRALERAWFPTTPSARLAWLRILVGSYALVFLLVRSLHLTSYATWDAAHFAPIGVVTALTGPLAPSLVYGLFLLTLIFCVAFVWGFHFRFTAPIFALLLLWVITYSNSWRFILHTENLLVMHVLVLAVSPAADALSWDTRGGATAPASQKYGWPIRLMCAVCVSAYLIAGVAKLRYSGWDFVSGDMLRNHVAFGSLRKVELGSSHSPIGTLLLGQPAVFAGLATVSLALELLSPLALFHRKFGQVWSVLLWGFHLGVLAVMLIAFVYPISFIAFAPFFRVERLPESKLGQRAASLYRSLRRTVGKDAKKIT